MSGDAAFRPGWPASDSTRSHPTHDWSSGLWCRCICSCRGLELAIDRSCCDCNSNFVIASASAQVNEIRIVRIVKNAQEVSLTEAFAVAAEKLPSLRANRCGR
jgi:hypothetical protein